MTILDIVATRRLSLVRPSPAPREGMNPMVTALLHLYGLSAHRIPAHSAKRADSTLELRSTSQPRLGLATGATL